MGNDAVMFNARFSGQPMTITVPVNAILAIYARENGQGMLFGEGDDTASGDESGDEDGGGGDDEPPQPPPGGGGGPPNLKVVK
jgi:stringent starvation protein B